MSTSSTVIRNHKIALNFGRTSAVDELGRNPEEKVPMTASQQQNTRELTICFRTFRPDHDICVITAAILYLISAVSNVKSHGVAHGLLTSVIEHQTKSKEPRGGFGCLLELRKYVRMDCHCIARFDICGDSGTKTLSLSSDWQFQRHSDTCRFRSRKFRDIPKDCCPSRVSTLSRGLSTAIRLPRCRGRGELPEGWLHR